MSLPNNVELSVSLSAQRKATTMKAEGFINKHNKPIALIDLISFKRSSNLLFFRVAAKQKIN